MTMKLQDFLDHVNRGALIAEGAGPAIRANPAVREIYLGSGATSGGH